jgi:hypothetical protein
VAKIEKDYEELLKLFNKYKVKYCIIGAYAVAFYAVPRYTKDIGVFIEAAPRNAKKIVKAINEFGFSSLNLKEKDFSEPGKTIQLGYEPLRIDFVTGIDGCTFEQVWKNRKKGIYGKEIVSFISLKDLIKNKKSSKRKQDDADLEILQLSAKKYRKLKKKK